MKDGELHEATFSPLPQIAAGQPTESERYVALLAWVARNHAADFADFVSHQDSVRRYLMLNREAVNEIRVHNHARQLEGTQFWAVMNVAAATKARFVRRLLEFIGCHDETVAGTLQVLGLDQAEPRGLRRLVG